MKIKNIIVLLSAFIITSCNEDDLQLTDQQRELIGQAVNFDASMADVFSTRTTYNHDGSFNENDQLTIYRQYISSNNAKEFDAESEISCVYVYAPTVSGSISLGAEWKAKNGDSLIWENDKTVRFRAWGRSNLADLLKNSSKSNYYPDFTISSWKGSYGPTVTIPLQMRHLACRIGISQKSGNELVSAEICTSASDYTDSEGTTAAEKAAAVQAVYELMCMPAGVNMTDETLYSITQEAFNSDNTDYKNIHESEGIVAFNTQTAEYIKNEVTRPKFTSNIDGRLYLISIPYQFSNNPSNEERTITLPGFTKFRIYLKDVNNGDHSNTPGVEGDCHYLTLADVSDDLKNGLTLEAGKSYIFSVGYQYNKFTVTLVDNLSWTEQDIEANNVSDETKTSSRGSYDWFQKGMENSFQNNTFTPVFTLNTKQDFLEFIQIVNGTTGSTKNGITDKGEKENKKWYLSDDEETEVPYLINDEQEGDHILYKHFVPQTSTVEAYSYLDCLDAAFSFYRSDLTSNNHFKVVLGADIDLEDEEIEAIGNSSAHPFSGFFDGAGHVIRNINVKGGALFGYIKGGAVTNLRMESVHTTSLANSITAGPEKFGAYIAGISLKAPSTSAIAQSITGNSYVVGCIHEGTATQAMVNSADNLFMFGCMETGKGITAGALLGAYSGTSKFFAPQVDEVKFNRFMCNYYDIEKSPSAHAVSTITDDYQPQQYIRGAKSHVLKAKTDNLLSDKLYYNKLTALQKQEFYGIAPWKAMNYAIYQYNAIKGLPDAAKCNMHYSVSSTGYQHLYPQLSKGVPTEENNWDVTQQNN